jgi:xanthine dehydrogenase accessory factor
MLIPFYRQLVESLKSGPVVVATVVSTRGSVPREVGARMMIDADGRSHGTIGGGAGEAKVIQAAKPILVTGEKQLVEIDLSGAPDRATQGVCGGQMQVWLERWSGKDSIALAQQILIRLESGQSVTLVTPFAADRSPYLEEARNREEDTEGGEDAEAQFPISNFQFPTPLSPPPPLTPPPLSRFPIPDSRFPFSELLHPPPILLIIGAGHCGIQLAKVADLIGFQVMVQDQREEWANRQHYPQAARIFTTPIATALTQLAHHTQLYAALLTRGYQYDLEALSALLKREIPCSYIGMIGSQKRVRKVKQAMEQAGFSVEQLRSLHAPIGLNIGALTPEEIAVSIAAELIQVRRGSKK